MTIFSHWLVCITFFVLRSLAASKVSPIKPVPMLMRGSGEFNSGENLMRNIVKWNPRLQPPESPWSLVSARETKELSSTDTSEESFEPISDPISVARSLSSDSPPHGCLSASCFVDEMDRVTSRYHPEIHSPGSIQLFERYMAIDEVKLVDSPDLSSNFESINRRRLELDEALIRSQQGSVFTFGEEDSIVIKYQTNCLATDATHPIVREYLIMEYISEVSSEQIVPIVYYLSRASPLIFSPVMTKLSIDPQDPKMKSCFAKGGSVRFLVEERAGVSLDRLAARNTGNKIPIKLAVSFGMRMIQAIQRLHELGIIHGDVHAGNFVVNPTGRLFMIDFGRSFFVNSNAPNRIRQMYSVNGVHVSPWEILGLVPGFRDDVFRVIQTMARLACGVDFFEALNRSDPKQSFRVRMTANFFTECGSDVFEGFSLNSASQAGEVFSEILGYIRGLTRVNDPIDYQIILSKLKQILTILV